MRLSFLCGLILLNALGLAAEGQLQLPTPREAYASYDPQTEALLLMSEISQELEARDRLEAIQLLTAFRTGQFETASLEQVRRLMGAVNWEKYRGRILRLVIYQSGILEAFSESSKKWLPLVHDFLLFFLNELSKERLIDRIVAQLQVKAEDRGRRLIALADRAPSLQKIGQIMARHPQLPAHMRRALQTFENSISTTRRDELVEFIQDDVGSEEISRYQMEFDQEVLAEASVGAVIRVELVLPQESAPRMAVCKVLKPYAVDALREELVILDGMVNYFEEHGSFYQLRQMPLSRMFDEARKALSKEIEVVEEQKNLARAAEYYRNSRKVKIPEIYPMSTPNVTFMEYIDGGKIVDALPDDQKARSLLANRLDDTLTWDVIFSRQEEAVFHGDPHAGNVFFLRNEPGRIALLDWGLCGILPRGQRDQLIQLLLGIYLKNKKRVRNNAFSLLEEGSQASPEDHARIQAIALNVMDESRATRKDLFLIMNEMVARLTKAGYSLEFNLVLFVKAQVTILGILKELDPKMKRGSRAFRQVSGRVFKEIPKRLLNTVYFPGWTSRDYPSMISNEDLRDVQFRIIGRAFKKLGSGFKGGSSSSVPSDESSESSPPSR